jgi:type I restriction enzyme M protein
MHTSIKQLIDYSSGIFPLEDDEFLELICACFVYVHRISQDKSPLIYHVDELLTFNDLNASIKTFLHLSAPLKVSRKNRPELEGALNEFIAKLGKLFNSKVINSNDLSDAVKEMYSKIESGFVIPNELCHLGVSLLGNSTQQVYCPFEKGCDFALSLPELSQATTETNSIDDVFYAKIQSALLNKSLSIIKTDPIENPTISGDGGLKKFDASIAMLPIGTRLKGEVESDIWDRFPERSLMGEVYYLRHMLAQSTGRVICFVSNAFLFRTAAGEYQFKEDMVENEWLEGVIALPRGLLPHTSVDISILILNQSKPSFTVKFFDATSEKFILKLSKKRNQLSNIHQLLNIYYNPHNYAEDEIVTSSKYDIADNEYNLSPARYVQSENDKKLDEFLSSVKTAPLNELVDIFRPQALQNDIQGNIDFLEYGLNNLNDIGHLDGSPRQLKLANRKLKSAKKQLIKSNDVLIVCRGAVGKVGFVPDTIEDNALANQAFVILRVKPLCRRMTPKALFEYLSSDYGRHHLSSLATGTTSLMLASKDISSMVVPAFNKVQQEALAVAHQQAIDKQNELDTIKKALVESRTKAIEGIAE